MAGDERPAEVFVLDTSSVIEIRRTIVANEQLSIQRAVYAELTKLARRGIVHFPDRVLEELRQGARVGKRKGDPPLDWAVSARALAVPDDDLLEYLPEVLAKVPGLADPDKPSPEDHADPYVIALGIRLTRRFGNEVSVVTEDTVAKPFKVSLRDACWSFRFATVSMRMFLGAQGIWPTRG